MNIKDEVDKLMQRVRKGRIPSSEAIVKETFQELRFISHVLNPQDVQRNFNRLLREAFIKTLEVLERYEDRAYAREMVDELMALRKQDLLEAQNLLEKTPGLQEGFRKALRVLLEKWYPYLRRGFLSISQSRKTRGGRDFELQFSRLLDLMEVPFEKRKRRYRVDFMIPSDEAFHHDPNRSLILSAKRTLRERWREVVEELQAMRSPNIYLITADENVSPGHVEGICRQYRIHLVVWDEVKKSRFPEDPLVISYTALANEIIPLFRQFWKSG